MDPIRDKNRHLVSKWRKYLVHTQTMIIWGQNDVASTYQLRTLHVFLPEAVMVGSAYVMTWVKPPFARRLTRAAREPAITRNRWLVAFDEPLGVGIRYQMRRCVAPAGYWFWQRPEVVHS